MARDRVRPGDLVATFENAPAGTITVCVAPLGDLDDTEYVERLEKTMDLDVKCEHVSTTTPDDVVTIETMPARRLDR